MCVSVFPCVFVCVCVCVFVITEAHELCAAVQVCEAEYAFTECARVHVIGSEREKEYVCVCVCVGHHRGARALCCCAGA